MAAAQGAHTPLLLFGHMHHQLRGGGRRDMAAVHAATGTLCLNAAVVPRVRSFPAAAAATAPPAAAWLEQARQQAAAGQDGGAGSEPSSSAVQGGTSDSGGTIDDTGGTIEGHHFLMVRLEGQAVAAASNIWVAALPGEAGGGGGGGGAQRVVLLESEGLVRGSEDGSRRCSLYQASAGRWVEAALREPRSPRRRG